MSAQRPLKVLALDTTEDGCSAALQIGDEVIERFEIAPRRHSELILPMMDGLLREAALQLADLDALAFARGPGSFTGVRIATAIAQGTAFGAGLPVVPVSSLQALAQGCARQHAAGAARIALDARMNEVYWGVYQADAGGVMQPLIDERVCPPGDVDTPGDVDGCGAGSGWIAYADVLAARCPGVVDVYAELRIHARDVAQLGGVMLRAGQQVTAEQAMPVYLRDKVAWAKS